MVPAPHRSRYHLPGPTVAGFLRYGSSRARDEKVYLSAGAGDEQAASEPLGFDTRLRAVIEYQTLYKRENAM